MSWPVPEILHSPALVINALTELEKWIRTIENGLPSLREWVIRGGNITASYCHVCRTVCRRVERHAVKIGAGGVGLAYLNLLLDYFFVLAQCHMIAFSKHSKQVSLLSVSFYAPYIQTRYYLRYPDWAYLIGGGGNSLRT